jgi:hypothetical protein
MGADRIQNLGPGEIRWLWEMFESLLPDTV